MPKQIRVLPALVLTLRSGNKVQLDYSVHGCEVIDFLSSVLHDETVQRIKRLRKRTGPVKDMVGKEIIADVEYLSKQMPAEVMREMLVALLSKDAMEFFAEQVREFSDKQASEAQSLTVQ